VGVFGLYDGDGRRVESSGGASGTRIYWYDQAGQVVMESMQGGSGFLSEYLYVGGQRVARVANLGPIYYYYGDHLGTARLITDGGGTKCYDADYFPWGGEQHVYVNSCAQNYKFTGKERDPDTGSDYFGARWYRNTMARFYSPDWSATVEPVPYAKLDNPQSLNLYTYVLDNPTTFGDPDGHCCWDAIVNWLTSSHSASASVGVDAGHSVDRAGGLTITSRAFAADASGSVAYGMNGVKGSAQASMVVASEKATEGSIGTTSTKALSADANANAAVSPTGMSGGAGANADVISATQTLKLGPVTLTATGNVGIGAEASASLSTTGASASAGVTPGFGGTLKISVTFGSATTSGGASAQSTSTGTGIKTTVITPKVDKN
jgi:RHS repeat-associated protein